MRTATRVALLAALWLLAWGELSLANLASGVVVAAALLAAFPPSRRSSGAVRVDLVGAGRLAAYVARQLVLSNLVMARQILRRTTGQRPGVLAHRLRQPSAEVVTVMTSVIALSPGTMTVDVDAASSTIYVHFFALTDPPAARAGLAHLEDLVSGALAGAAPDAPATHPSEGPG